MKKTTENQTDLFLRGLDIIEDIIESQIYKDIRSRIYLSFLL